MDEEIRRLQRAYDESEMDCIALEKLLAAQNRARIENLSENWINIYEDNLARATLQASETELKLYCVKYLCRFYQRHKIFFQGRQVQYVGEDQPVWEPSAKIRVAISNQSNFDDDGPINLPGGRDYPVSLVLVEDIEAETEKSGESEEPAPTRAAYYVNAYEFAQAYGGPEEGGWYRDTYYPQGGMYIGMTNLSSIEGLNPNKAIYRISLEAANFLRRYLAASGYVSLQKQQRSYRDTVGNVFVESHPPKYQEYPEGSWS
jgi:hypothetical protein